MQPLGWLPDYPRWKRRHRPENHSLAKFGVQVLDGELIQRIGDEIVILQGPVPTVASGPLSVHCQEPENPGTDEATTSQVEGRVSNINAVWNTKGLKGRLLLKPVTFDISMLQADYERTLLSTTPLALYPKQVLAGARVGLSAMAYASILHQLLINPQDIDTKYRYGRETGSDTPFIATVRELENDMRPMSKVLQELKVRDSQMQVILGLELHALGLASVTSDEVDSATVELLDQHFDRLCIWQAVSGTKDIVDNFISTVLYPFYKAKAPRKVKSLMKITKGTLKSRSKQKPTLLASTNYRPVYGTGFAPTPSQPVESLPAFGGFSGLAKAISMRRKPDRGDDTARVDMTGNAKCRDSSTSLRDSKRRQEDDATSQTKRRVAFSAGRTFSHPVYRQKSLPLEVRFTNKRSFNQGRVRSKHVPSIRVEEKEEEPEEVVDDIISSTDSDGD